MAKRFKTKNKMRLRYRMILFLIFLIISFFYFFDFLYNKFFLEMNNDKLLSYLIDYNLNTNKDDELLYDIINLNSTDFLLKYTLGVENEENDLEETEEVSGVEASYVEDPYESNVNDPIIYIYNTHQTEGYQKSNNASYNITPSVLMASYILRESLNDLGLPTMVETNNITEILRVHNWKYSYSYAASKILMQDAISKNSKLTYFIDLHRDSMNYDVTTTTINQKQYAKVLFVVGKDHDNYLENLAFAEAINGYMKEFNPDLTRGISLKGGSGVNGIYNQDIHPNTILVELGGQYNNIVEVNNTIEVLAEAIFKYVKGEL